MQATEEQRQKAIEQVCRDTQARLEIFLKRRLQIAKLSLERAALVAEEAEDSGKSPPYTGGLSVGEKIIVRRHEVEIFDFLLEYLPNFLNCNSSPSNDDIPFGEPPLSTDYIPFP